MICPKLLNTKKPFMATNALVAEIGMKKDAVELERLLNVFVDRSSR